MFSNVAYIVLVVGVMTVVMVLGFAGDQFGPLGSLLLVLTVPIIFVSVAVASGKNKTKWTGGVPQNASVDNWDQSKSLGGGDWMQVIVDSPELARQIRMEVDRSRRYDRSFSTLVIVPQMDVDTEQAHTADALQAYRLFVQEIVVRNLRTTDTIGNSASSVVTIAILPETDAEGTDIASTRIREDIAASNLKLGSESNKRVAVRAINYPSDATDSTGIFELIQEFENASTS